MDIQKRLAHPKTVVVIVFALIIILMLLFQKEERLSKLFKQVHPDHLSILYLQLLLQMEPERSDLRITLADQLSKLGQLDKAKQMLEPLLLKKGKDTVRTRLLSLEIDMKKYFSIDPQHPSRKSALSRLKEKMLAISSENIPADLLPQAIKISLALNLPSLAADLYVIRASVDTENYAKWLKEAGRWYIASGNPVQASQIFKSGFDTAIKPELAFDFALLSIDALRAANQPETALKLVEYYLTRFPQDISLLDEAIALAQEANKPNQAIRWGKLRLALSNNDPVQIEKQINLAVSANDLPLALHLSEQLISLQPDDTSIRLRTAQIAEWTGKPEIALSHWRWLAQYENDETSIQNSLRLAKGLYRGETIIEMLKLKSQIQPLSRSEIQQLTFAFGQADPEQLISILTQYLARYPSDHSTWELLAKLQTDAGYLDDAITTWQKIITHFGRSSHNLTQLARLLWKQWEPNEALAILDNNIDKVSNYDFEFWKLLGDIAWQLEQTKTALLSYQTLWKYGKPDEFIASRLFQLLTEMNRTAKAITLAEHSFLKFKQPRWLILAMNSSIRDKKWKKLEQLIKTSNKYKQLFAKHEAYWLLRAQYATHKHKFSQAQTYYSKAIAMNSESVAAKSGLLWSLINNNKTQVLDHYLRMWAKNTQSQPLLWSAFAAGFYKLGQPQNALVWFERQAMRNPNDYLWLLNFADALDASHQTDAALRLRRYVFTKLGIQIDQYQDQPPQNLLDTTLLDRSYVALKQKFFGPGQVQNTLSKLLKKGINDQVIHELVIEFLLDQNNFDAAHYWLTKTHKNRLQQPAWQQLAIALADNDQESIERILETSGSQLTPSTHIAALKQIGKTGEALTMAHNLIEENPNQSDNNQIQQQYTDLLFATSRHAKFAWGLKNLGGLEIQQSSMQFSIPTGNSHWSIQAGYNQLDSSGPNLSIPSHNEVDISVKTHYPLSFGTLHLKVGGNFQNDASLVYGSMKLDHQFSRILKGDFILGLNEISYDTAMLRALGAKDKISLGFTTQLSKQSSLQFNLEGHRYNTRQGTNLANGYKLDFTLGHNLLMGDPYWQVRLHGAWENNFLENHLPYELISVFNSSSATIEDIVTPKYGTFGMGTTFRYGTPQQGFLSEPFILADIWTGWVWPDNSLAYNFQISAGLPIIGPDVLSINAFYGNTQGGRTDQAYRGVGIQYEFRF